MPENPRKEVPVPFGLLAVHKEPGPTSFDLIKQIRRMLPRGVKIGHMGTLDPFAEGLLLVGIGSATRFMDHVHQLPKQYEAVIQLGKTTDTLDTEGRELETAPVPRLEQDRLNALAVAMSGPQQQIPPAFSAKKVAGKRAYQLARDQAEFQLQPADIVVHQLELKPLDDSRLFCRVICSAGTYIRALGRDIAQRLGTLGYLTQLKRTAIGPCTWQQGLSLSQLEEQGIAPHLMPIEAVLPQFPQKILPQEALDYLLNGRPFSHRDTWPDTFIGICRQGDQVQAMFKCEWHKGLKEIRSRQICFRSGGVLAAKSASEVR